MQKIKKYLPLINFILLVIVSIILVNKFIVQPQRQEQLIKEQNARFFGMDVSSKGNNA